MSVENPAYCIVKLMDFQNHILAGLRNLVILVRFIYIYICTHSLKFHETKHFYFMLKIIILMSLMKLFETVVIVWYLIMELWKLIKQLLKMLDDTIVRCPTVLETVSVRLWMSKFMVSLDNELLLFSFWSEVDTVMLSLSLSLLV